MKDLTEDKHIDVLIDHLENLRLAGYDTINITMYAESDNKIISGTACNFNIDIVSAIEEADRLNISSRLQHMIHDAMSSIVALVKSKQRSA